MLIRQLWMLALLTLAACGEGTTPAPTHTADDAADGSMVSVYAQAVASPRRTDADRERDAGRKPGQVLEFFQIAPGMTVLDMFSGGGYYTEMLSEIAGPDGKIVAHTNTAYAGFVGDEAVERYADNRLANVEILLAENNELELPEAEFDVVMLILSYHDIYFVDVANGWPKIDAAKFLAELEQGLKPGGILAVVDSRGARRRRRLGGQPEGPGVGGCVAGPEARGSLRVCVLEGHAELRGCGP